MKKVLHLINGEHFSGTERVQDLLAIGLAKLDVEVSFVCVKKGRFGEFRASSNPIYGIYMRSKFDWETFFEIRSLIRRERIAVVHTHTPRTALIGAFAVIFTKTPLIHHAHSPTASDSGKRLNNLVNAVAERLALTRAKKVLAVSDKLVDYLLKWKISKDKISLVENGVPVHESIWRSHSGGSYRIAMSALFRPRKGVETVLRALKFLKTSSVRVDFYGIGEFETQPYFDEVMALARELGVTDQVHWLGFSADVYASLKGIDAFVLSSLYGEGLPMALIEAMSIGIPVIGSRIPGIKETLEPDGGVLFEAGSGEDLAKNILNLIQSADFAKSLSISGQKRQRNYYSDLAMARSVKRAYEEVLNEV